MSKPFAALLLAVLLAWVPAASAQDLVLTNARILDGTGGVIERGTVVVRGGTIASVSAGAAPAAGGARVIDLNGMTVMPGFIDAHRHPIGGGEEWLKSEARGEMQQYLDAGFTTVLSAGDDPATALALREQLASGAIRGPRLIVAGRVATAGPTGGGGRGAGPRIDPARSDRSRAPRTETAPAIPAPQTRAAVAAMAKLGVDAIKTNIIVTPNGTEGATLTLIAQEARKYDIPVITHAVTVEDTIAAVKAGVQTLVHTPHIGQLTMEQARMIARAGIPMISTLGVFVPHFDGNDNPLFRDRQPFPWETLSSGGQGPVNARLLWEAGITYGYGTDTSWHPRDSLALELRPLSLVFSPRQIVRILTANAAAAIHRADRGTLAAGKLGDLVVLDGDPLADPSNLLRVALVVTGGEVVVDRR